MVKYVEEKQDQEVKGFKEMKICRKRVVKQVKEKKIQDVEVG